MFWRPERESGGICCPVELRSLLTDSFRETDEKLLSWLQSEHSQPLLAREKDVQLCKMILILWDSASFGVLSWWANLYAMLASSAAQGQSEEASRDYVYQLESVCLQAARQKMRRMLERQPRLLLPGATRLWSPMSATREQFCPEGVVCLPHLQLQALHATCRLAPSVHHISPLEQNMIVPVRPVRQCMSCSGGQGPGSGLDGRAHGDRQACLGMPCSHWSAVGGRGQAVDLTTEHRVTGSGPTVEAEVHRVESVGGWIEDGRVCDVIAVSRAFGDAQFKGDGPKDMLQQGVR